HAHFGVDDVGAQIVAGVVALDDRVREAVHALVVTRYEIDRDAEQPPRPAQNRQVLLDDALRALGAREILGPHVRDLFTGITEAAQPGVAGIDEESVLVQRYQQSGTAAEKPLVLLGLRHKRRSYGFPLTLTTENRDLRK